MELMEGRAQRSSLPVIILPFQTLGAKISQNALQETRSFLFNYNFLNLNSLNIIRYTPLLKNDI